MKNFTIDELTNTPTLNLYVACFSRAKNLDTVEKILKDNPKQMLSDGFVIDFTVEGSRPPYATLPGVQNHWPECSHYIIRTLAGNYSLLVEHTEGEFIVVGKSE